MTKIYCSVSNCRYWKKGNICNANQIMVTSDDMGDWAMGNLEAANLDDFEETPVESSMETCCQTFINRGQA